MASEKLNAAIKSIEAGDKTAAMRILAGIVTTDPKNEMAWFWLSKCVEENDRKRYCLAKALAINPNNVHTRQALAQLESFSQPSFEEPIARTSELPKQPPPKPTTSKVAPLEAGRKVPPLQKDSSTNPTITVSTTIQSPPLNRHMSGCLIVCILIAVGTAIIWFVVQPGVVAIQPIGALPDGVTFIYHSRNPEMPFFSSPDGLCLKTQGSVTLLCRGAAISAISKLTDRMIIKLPYSRWAYLLSTGGVEFEK